MGTVVYADFGRDEIQLSKKELATRLGYTTRHIEKLTAEGMPSEMEGVRRVYKETAARNWLGRHERRVANA